MLIFAKEVVANVSNSPFSTIDGGVATKAMDKPKMIITHFALNLLDRPKVVEK
jgi:hypothetical protein